MNRRNAITGAVALTAAGLSASASAQTPAPAGKAIVLNCDLRVDPEREEEMLIHFHKVFKPAGEKFRGFIDLKMLKLRTLIQGDAPPAGVNYRFQLTYENEELRQIWVNSDVHRQVWAGIETTLVDKNFQVLLFDDA